MFCRLLRLLVSWAYADHAETEDANDLSGPALVVFDQEAETTMTLQSTPRRIHNRDPVTAKAVPVDLVSWKLMCNAEDGTTGHAFVLSKGGAMVAKIEVHTEAASSSALRRVAIVQASYRPLSMAAGVADASSLLVFEDPAAHLRGLREVAEGLRVDAELGYAPVAECCVTDAFQRLNVQLGTKDAHTPEHQTARAVWKLTKGFLKSLSAATAECIDLYTSVEIERTGATELRGACRKWRAFVG